MSSKIHATVDALGNPTAFVLTPGQVHDLQGADRLLERFEHTSVIADKVYDAYERVSKPLQARDTAQSQCQEPAQL